MAHDFLKTLEKEHDSVQDILNKLEDTSSGAVKTKEELFKKLKKELTPHMKGEEKYFYPALQSHKESADTAMESLEEHHVAEMMLKELDSLSKDADNWDAKLKVFKEIVNHHIEEEEDTVFDAAEDVLSDQELDEIMESFQEEKLARSSR